MSELTELEICKRIAEIEGIPHTVNVDYLGNKKITLPSKYCDENKCSFVYNPLTDDTLCFRLMKEDIKSRGFEVKWCPIDKKYEVGYLNPLKDFKPYTHSSLNMAYCLAKIAEHKDREIYLSIVAKYK